MQPIKNYLFDINGNRVIVFRSEDDAITLNNPFISIKVVNINNKVFIHDRENKFIHFNNHYDAEVISLEYKDDTVFSMKTLSEEEFESFNAANIKQEIKKIIALNNIEKQVLLEQHREMINILCESRSWVMSGYDPAQFGNNDYLPLEKNGVKKVSIGKFNLYSGGCKHSKEEFIWYKI